MAESLTEIGGSRSATLRSAVKAALLIGICVRFGPSLLGLISMPSGEFQVVATAGGLSRIPEAVTTAKEEYRRVKAEREAFEAFTAGVRELDTVEDLQSDASDMGGIVFHGSTATTEPTTDSIQDLYRETFMSVDHYDEEYNEPLRTNASAELGLDLEAVLATNSRLTPPLKRELIRASRTAARDRKRFQTLVKSELNSLTDAQSQVQSAAETATRIHSGDLVGRSIAELEAQTQRLQTIERECKSLVEDRQAEYVSGPEGDGIHFKEYLYDQHEWTHPVVCDALDVIRSLREAKHRVESTLIEQLK